MRTTRATALAVALAVVAGACGGTAAPPAAAPSVPASSVAAATAAPVPTKTPYPIVKMTVAYDGISITTGPLQYTFEQGYFKKYGLDVDLQAIAGGSTLTAAVVGGTVPFAQNGYEPALTAALQGADIVLVGGISNKLPYQFLVSQKYAAPGALKGSNAKLAISRFGSSSDLALRAVLKHQGVDPDKDVALLQIGGEPERSAALLSGQIDGTVLQYPASGVMEKRGFKIIDNAADLIDVPNTSYVTSRAYLKANRDVAKRFFMALIEGIHAYKTEPDKAIASTAKFLAVSIDDMRPAYQYYVANIYPDVPKPTLTGIKTLFETSISRTEAKAKTAKPEDFVDTTIFDELEREGFIKQVLGK